MSKANILILEDNAIVALDIEKVISKLDVNVLAKVDNAESVFDIAQNNKIDILISDIDISGDIDGIETSKVLQHKYGTHIIFLTGLNEEETVLRASSVEFVGYLLKPFREDELELLVNLIINKHHLNTKADVVQINEHHSYCKEKGILYLNEKELYLSRNENKLFKKLFESINTAISYHDFDFDTAKRKLLTSNLNVKLKGMIIRDLKVEESILLTFK